jgi:hypothetical protein
LSPGQQPRSTPEQQGLAGSRMCRPTSEQSMLQETSQYDQNGFKWPLQKEE